MVRAIIQLVIVGYILKYVFGFESLVFLLLFMLFNAAKKAKPSKQIFMKVIGVVINKNVV